MFSIVSFYYFHLFLYVLFLIDTKERGLRKHEWLTFMQLCGKNSVCFIVVLLHTCSDLFLFLFKQSGVFSAMTRILQIDNTRIILYLFIILLKFYSTTTEYVFNASNLYANHFNVPTLEIHPTQRPHISNVSFKNNTLRNYKILLIFK
jgi:hypothetical protein